MTEINCEKSLYDTSNKDEFQKRFNIISTLKDLNLLMSSLNLKEKMKKTLLYVFNNSTSTFFISIRIYNFFIQTFTYKFPDFLHFLLLGYFWRGFRKADWLLR